MSRCCFWPTAGGRVLVVVVVVVADQEEQRQSSLAEPGLTWRALPSSSFAVGLQDEVQAAVGCTESAYGWVRPRGAGRPRY